VQIKDDIGKTVTDSCL